LTKVLLFILLIMFLGRAVLRLVSGIVEGASAGSGGGRAVSRGVQMARDPVCGTFVVPSSELMVVEGDRAAYFCSERCRAAYRAGSGAKTRSHA
jgi:YHS domain-containing protein